MLLIRWPISIGWASDSRTSPFDLLFSQECKSTKGIQRFAECPSFVSFLTSLPGVGLDDSRS